MRGKIIVASLILVLSGVAASAQDRASNPFPNNVYCSGVVTSEAVPHGTYVITGEESNALIAFSQNDYVYVNRGSSQGVKVGDQFLVVRPVEDTIKIDWTKWQTSILHKMGTVWEDEGRLRVTAVRPNVSIAQVQHACEYLQRGDIALPFVERPEPALKPEANFDRFAPANGKPLAMIITGKRFQQQVGRNDIVYVNLGSQQGVKVGNYFRIFRYTGTQNETAFQTPRFAFDVDGDLGPTYGYGRVSKEYNWTNVPREDIGEGVVLRTGPNSATVLITLSLREIYAGDYVELE